MTDQVKPGQVWMDENTGERVTLREDGHDNCRGWVAENESGRTKCIPVSRLVDDWILVKEAP